MYQYNISFMDEDLGEERKQMKMKICFETDCHNPYLYFFPLLETDFFFCC